MAKTFDATLKHLIDVFADDWGTFLIEQLGLPKGCRAEPIEADLSTVSPEADKLFHVTGPLEEYAHLELQSSWSGALADRVLVYNVLAGHRYGLPVQSVVVLLRPEANASMLTGELRKQDAAGRVFAVRLSSCPFVGNAREGTAQRSTRRYAAGIAYRRSTRCLASTSGADATPCAGGGALRQSRGYLDLLCFVVGTAI